MCAAARFFFTIKPITSFVTVSIAAAERQYPRRTKTSWRSKRNPGSLRQQLSVEAFK
jgi:hypothetical protein